MYYVYVDGVMAFDAAADAQTVASATLSQQSNAAAYLDMECLPTLAVSEGESVVEVRWDREVLFHGRVTEVGEAIDGLMSVSAVSDVDRLNDVLVRPHSTDGSVGETCPDELGAYFDWLVARYNERAVGGFRIDVGTNQGDRLAADGDALSVSEGSYQTVAATIEANVLSHGGHLEFRPFSGGGTIDLWADLHEASEQLVDLGENVVSIEVTRDAASLATAIVPYSGSGDSEVTLDGASDADLALATNAGMMVSGDAIYDPEAVARWGYRERRVELPGVGDTAALVRAAVPELRTMLAPTLTITCRAVDMAMYRDGYEHLRVGQAVRVRAARFGVDEYLAVQSASLDLLDPAQTSYELGVTYDTLTGQQSAFLSGLNGSINHAVDQLRGVEDTLTETTGKANLAIIQAQQAQQAASDASKVATNYLDYSEQLGGLVVGNLVGEGLGPNVLVAHDGVRVRDDTTVMASYLGDGTHLYQEGAEVASFGSSTVELGKNSISSVIKMCAGAGTISAEQGSTRPILTLSSGSLIIDGYTLYLEGSGSGNASIDLSYGEVTLTGESKLKVSSPVVEIDSSDPSIVADGRSFKIRPLFRLSNPNNNNAKMFTCSDEERYSLISAGWDNEGIACYVLYNG